MCDMYILLFLYQWGFEVCIPYNYLSNNCIFPGCNFYEAQNRVSFHIKNTPLAEVKKKKNKPSQTPYIVMLHLMIQVGFVSILHVCTSKDPDKVRMYDPPTERKKWEKLNLLHQYQCLKMVLFVEYINRWYILVQKGRAGKDWAALSLTI